jgi:hypothetical protein
MDNETKNILTSKTFWVNLLTIGVIIANRKGKVIDPMLIEPVVVVILPFVNILLRTITSTPVKVLPK